MDGNLGPTEQVLWPASVFCGIILSKISYEMTGSFSSTFFKCYDKLSKAEKIEWNNRGISTFHAILVAAASFYLIVLSDLFVDGSNNGLIIDKKSTMSDFIFGISMGYFLSDLGMILWLFPSLGGMEYILHHGLSIYSLFLALVSGKGHMYIFMVLLSEITTPFVNLRWYLELAGQKSSMFYICNGVALFFGWLVARVLLFIYLLIHMYLHFDQIYFQVRPIFPLGFYSILVVPPVLAAMNAYWFWKISKGLKKTISKKRHGQ